MLPDAAAFCVAGRIMSMAGHVPQTCRLLVTPPTPSPTDPTAAKPAFPVDADACIEHDERPSCGGRIDGRPQMDVDVMATDTKIID